MKIFGDEHDNKIEIAVSQPILEKPEKGQQPKLTDHFINIQAHIDGNSHKGKKYDIQNNPKFFHGRLSYFSGVQGQDIKI